MAKRKVIDNEIELVDEPNPLYKVYLGLIDKKKVGLFLKYCPLVDKEYGD